MTLSEIIRESIWEHCQDWCWSAQSDFEELATSVLERLEKEDFLKEDYWDELQQAMDDEMIYTEDQWKMIELYCNPQDASFDFAWEYFQSDLGEVVEIIKRKLEEEED